MRLWLDDKRKPPEGFELALTGQEAVKMLMTGTVEFISFDHDLGDGMTGYDVACCVEEMASNGSIGKMGWEVHSANPPGAERIEAAMRSADRLWKKQEEME